MSQHSEVVPEAVGDVARLADELLARARSQNPGVEFSITLDQAHSLLLPKTADEIIRTVQGRLVAYSGHVYNDALVDAVDFLPEYADRVAVVPLFEAATPVDTPTYEGDLHTGRITWT
ncbi:MAG: hypothetical protein ACRCYU_13125 [Nocardioides sp.]